MEDLKKIVKELEKKENGFKYIIDSGDEILSDMSVRHFEIASILLEYQSYQPRMLAAYIFGELWKYNDANVEEILKTKIAYDNSWRVQEMLAKAFDNYCAKKGYKNSMGKIEEWLSEENPNLKRAVIEGLRIWTNRSFFKDNPGIAIRLISKNRANESEYLRKSVANSLTDISKRFPNLVKSEIKNWNMKDPKVFFTRKLVRIKENDNFKK